MRKSVVLMFFIGLVIFITFMAKSKAEDYPSVHLTISSIKETPDGFVVNGSVTASGPHDRIGIYDVYSLNVYAIIKNDSNARYPHFKEWAYEQASIDYYYPTAETRYVPGSGSGGTMTEEEAYGVNVTTISLFHSGELGGYNFSSVIPLAYAGKEFRIQATLAWDFTGVNAYWWAHRYVNDIGCEGILGKNFKFLYSDGVNVTYPDGSSDNKFSWKSNWPNEDNITFHFTKNNSYLALWGASLIGNPSVSGKITRDGITIIKNDSTPLEFTSIGGQYLIAGEGEVSIVPEIRDENGTILLKGWGNLTDEVSPENWNNWTGWIKYLTYKIGNISGKAGKYIWEHKIEITGGIIIKVITGMPGFVFTAPTKYVSKALGYLSVPLSEGEKEEARKILNAYNQSFKSYGVVKTGYGGVVHYCKLYIISNESGMSVYLVDGKAMLEGKNGSINITGGESATILKNGSITLPTSFNENEVKEETGLTMDTLWKMKEIESKDFILCKNLDKNEKPIEATTVFSNNDTVYAWLSLQNASNGDEIKFVFEGPNNITKELEYPINWSGNGYCYAWLSMSHYRKNAIGQWKVTTYINGEKSKVAYFDVNAKTTSNNTPGFEFILLFISLAILFIWRRRN